MISQESEDVTRNMATAEILPKIGKLFLTLMEVLPISTLGILFSGRYRHSSTESTYGKRAPRHMTLP